MSDTPNEPSVPVEELQALVDEWRSKKKFSLGGFEEAAYMECVGDLKAVIEAYE